MRWHVKLLTPPSSDTTATVYVHFDSARYIFNAGEGTTRTAFQRGTSVKKVGQVFLTSAGVESGAGLPGLLMTMADSGMKQVDVFGPRNLTHFIATMRLYTQRDTMTVTPHEVELSESASARPIFEDDNMSVFGVPLLPDSYLNSTQPNERKRKRPDSSPQRQEYRSPKLFSHLDSASGTISSVNNGRTEGNMDVSGRAWMRRDFAPRGRDADRFREAIVKDMFIDTDTPEGRALLPAPKPESSTEVSMDGAQGVLISRAPRPIRGPSRCSKPLPPPPLPFPQDNPASASWSSPPLAVSYICVAKPMRGKFDVAKAKQLGLKPGPAYAALTRGEDVTTEDGRTIRSADVLGPTRPGSVFFVMRVPTVEHIPPLLLSPAWEAFRPREGGRVPTLDEDPLMRMPPHLIVHQVADDVLEDERYQAWMRGFGDNVHHTIASPSYCADRVMFPSSALSQLRLNKLNRDIFTLPKYELDPRKSVADVPNLPASVAPFTADAQVVMEPKGPPALPPPGVNFDFAAPSPKAEKAASALSHRSSTPSEQARSEQAWKDFCEAVQEARELIEKEEKENSGRCPHDDFGLIVTALGTGSAMPSKYRNVSATLIQTPSSGSILLDAGENTWGQLCRRFGRDSQAARTIGGLLRQDAPNTDMPVESAQDVLRSVKLLFVSHIHADHHAGVSRLLVERRKLSPPPTEPLFVIANEYTRLYLSEYHQVEDLALGASNGVHFIDAEHLDWQHGVDGVVDDPSERSSARKINSDRGDSRRKSKEFVKQLKDASGLSSVQVVSMDHRTWSCYGLVVTHKDGWKIAYSGDTRPHMPFVEAGKDATLLVHEATIEDEKPEVADFKGHSTFGQAIDVGVRMRAKHILLTHFSQRYPKFPRLTLPSNAVSDASAAAEPTSSSLPPVIAPSFDLMTLALSSMWKMSHYTNAMSKLFAADVDDDDEGERLVRGGVDELVERPGGGEKKGKGDGKKKKKRSGQDVRVEEKKGEGEGGKKQGR